MTVAKSGYTGVGAWSGEQGRSERKDNEYPFPITFLNESNTLWLFSYECASITMAKLISFFFIHEESHFCFSLQCCQRRKLREKVSMMKFASLQRTGMRVRTGPPIVISAFSSSNRAWDLRKKNGKKYWNRGDNKPWRCEQHVKNYDFKDAFVLKTNQFDRE